jgi:transposase-like protein
MTDSGLSAQQQAVICALSSGATSTDAAAQAGVHRNTIANWRRNLLPFQYALANAQYDRALFFREKIEEQAHLAIENIQQILTDPKAPASIRLRAALVVMKVASTPPEPKKRTELDIEKIVHPRTEPEVVTEDQLGVVANPPEVHNSAQSCTTVPRGAVPPDRAGRPVPPPHFTQMGDDHAMFSSTCMTRT